MSLCTATQALRDGLVSEAVLDATVGRVLTQKFAAGLFDRPLTSLDRLAILDSPAHRDLARSAAEEGVVLLQNHNTTLPMALKGRRIGLFGPLASDPNAFLGSYTLSGAPVVTLDVRSADNPSADMLCALSSGPPSRNPESPRISAAATAGPAGGSPNRTRRS